MMDDVTASSPRRTPLVRWAVIALLLATGACRIDPSEPDAARGGEIATVTRVVDGDTIEVRTADGLRKVRYIGVDTPERGECYFSQATEANRRLVEGRRVELVKDVSETDRYRRLLRYAYVGDTFVNEALVRDGFAAATTFPPDVAHAPAFLALQREARASRRGLWAPGACSTLPRSATSGR